MRSHSFFFPFSFSFFFLFRSRSAPILNGTGGVSFSLFIAINSFICSRIPCIHACLSAYVYVNDIQFIQCTITPKDNTKIYYFYFNIITACEISTISTNSSYFSLFSVFIYLFILSVCVFLGLHLRYSICYVCFWYGRSCLFVCFCIYFFVSVFSVVSFLVDFPNTR